MRCFNLIFHDKETYCKNICTYIYTHTHICKFWIKNTSWVTMQHWHLTINRDSYGTSISLREFQCNAGTWNRVGQGQIGNRHEDILSRTFSKMSHMGMNLHFTVITQGHLSWVGLRQWHSTVHRGPGSCRKNWLKGLHAASGASTLGWDTHW